MAEKVTTMKLEVDLQCDKCYKKVKKVLCNFPEIRDQTYDEKQNIVTITVVCCNPEKMRDKIYCKGGCCIKRIEIVVPPKTEPPPPKKEKADPKPPPPQKGKADPKPPPPQKEKADPKPPPPPPPSVSVMIGTCCVLCYEGRPCGRRCHGYGRPPPCCDGCYGRRVCDCYGWGRPCYVSRCDQYFSDENPEACTIM